MKVTPEFSQGGKCLGEDFFQSGWEENKKTSSLPYMERKEKSLSKNSSRLQKLSG